MNIKLFIKQLHHPGYIRRHSLRMLGIGYRPALKDILGTLEAVVHPWNCKEYYACIKGLTFHLASFYNRESYERFLKVFGLHLEPICRPYGETSEYHKVRERFKEGYFWNRLQVPLLARKITLLSNGHYVTGYWRRRGDTIEVYRPSPNAWLVYSPVEKIDDIRRIQNRNGIF